MDINQLYGKIYTDKFYKKEDNFIKFIELNSDLIDNTAIGDDQELHDKILRLTADYAHFLTIRECYRKALPPINKAISLFELHPEYSNTDLFSILKYEYLFFDRAIANYHIKNIKSAIKDLQILHAKFPDNVKYDNWLNSALKYQTRRISEVILYIIIGAGVLSVFLDKERTGVLYDISHGIIIIGLIVELPLILVLRNKKKKIK